MSKLKRGIDLCTVSDCGRVIFAKTWCKRHYDRNHRSGSPTVVHTPGRTPSGRCRISKCFSPVHDGQEHYCSLHYEQYLNLGKNPELASLTPIPTPEEYFWRSVNKKGADECWIWGGHTTKRKGRRGDGYGRFSTGGKHYLAHRFSYALSNKLEAYQPVHHKCAKTLCVNPKHLQTTTPEENNAEMFERRWYQKRIAELEEKLAKCTC